jgi:HEPN domain-containing protein
MPPEGRARELALDWFRHARSNLALARQPKPAEALWENLAFEAQQAIEKAIKAVLVLHGIDFPRTHDVGELLGLLAAAQVPCPEPIARADRLTDYATAARYPGHPDPVTEAECREAVTLAERFVRWAEDLIRAG